MLDVVGCCPLVVLPTCHHTFDTVTVALNPGVCHKLINENYMFGWLPYLLSLIRVNNCYLEAITDEV
ncbi:hypothetical protein Ahy_B02g060092 isoform A [Arachis hypogaea]|uniref:Uncharacterized protein n=1 Tax=Arachis hypogaea TaxID=3818 RepID=A0A445AHV8_ARAHY|nr:hypothetical protein Ahy_B02g060092 isoform A [Arachis hypogaea]